MKIAAFYENIVAGALAEGTLWAGWKSTGRTAGKGQRFPDDAGISYHVYIAVYTSM